MPSVINQNLKRTPQYSSEFKAIDCEELKEPLTILLSSREEAQALMNLKGRQATSFLDLLDRVTYISLELWPHLTELRKMMDFVEPTSALYSQCLRRLRRLCGAFGDLPSSCMLNSEKLERTSPEALLSGGFADIWKGTYKESDTVTNVAIKVLRIYGKDNLQIVKQVSLSIHGICDSLILWNSAFVKKLSCGEDSLIPTFYVSLEPLPHSFHFA
jgi:hypothetical protein